MNTVCEERIQQNRIHNKIMNLLTCLFVFAVKYVHLHSTQYCFNNDTIL